MNKKVLLLLLTIFLAGSVTVNAQQNYELKCVMTVEQIQNSQSWNIDDPKSEFTKNIAIGLMNNLELIYNKLNQDNKDEIDELILAIDEFVIEAQDLGMNYSMFDEDLQIIESLK